MKLELSFVGAVADRLLDGLMPKDKGFAFVFLGIAIAGYGLYAILK